MKVLTVLLTLAIAFVFIGSAIAVPPGKTVEYPGGDAGKIVFDGKFHADKGLKCIECHTKIFPMKKGQITMKMAEINEGKYCGVCHNGTKSFKTSEKDNCAKCHKK